MSAAFGHGSRTVAGSEGGARRHAVIGTTALVWSVLFCGVHVYWLAGGSEGMEGHQLGGPLRWIDIAAAVLSVVAATLALLLMRDRGPFPRWLLLTGAWVACAVLGLRGAEGVAVDLVVCR